MQRLNLIAHVECLWFMAYKILLDWWKADSWVPEKEVETTMVDVGQFD